MGHLYAPWRSEYLLKQPSLKRGCIFCKKQTEKQDRKNFILFRGKTSFVLMNLYPYNDGHVMIAPYRHAASPNGLSKEEWRDLNELLRQSLAILEKAFRPGGFNIGINLGEAAGAGIAEHLHLHLVPRWPGDTNFLPVVGKTKVINQNLKQVYKKLFPLFNETGQR